MLSQNMLCIEKYAIVSVTLEQRPVLIFQKLAEQYRFFRETILQNLFEVFSKFTSEVFTGRLHFIPPLHT